MDKQAIHRVAFITSHPIQYQAPLFRSLAARQDIDLTVFFCSRWGLESYRDPGFGKAISWDVDLLSGYQHRFLPNHGFATGPVGFAGLVNPSICSMASGGFDAVISTGWFTANHWITWVASILANVPLLLRAESNGLSEECGWKRFVKHALLRTMFSRVGAFLAIGTHSVGYYRSLRVPAEKIFMCPYAVENDRFFAAHEKLRNSKMSLRSRFGISPEVPLFLFSGKLSSVKRPLDLLQAFHASQQRGASASLAFVGDGELRAVLEGYVRQHNVANVVFLGFRNQTEISECYAMADVLVLPSGHEPWGLVVNEAMCFGLAILASDRVGCVPDLVKEGANGYSFQTGDVGQLSTRLAQLAEDPGMIAQFGRESKRLIGEWGIREGVDGIVASLNEIRRRKSE
jgi:glycosyltransferase involved in cell wall biosynthesis